MNLQRFFSCATVGAAILLLAGTAHAFPTLGPQWPPVGGVTFGTSGASSPGDLGGINFHFTGFDPTAFTELYWGPWGTTATDVGAGLDGALHPFVFSRIAGTAAFWKGVSNWTNPQTQQTTSARMELAIDISGLGMSPWVAAGGVGGTVSPGLGAVVSNPLGKNFTANLRFVGDVGSGFQALNTIQQATSGLTKSSFTGGFYSTPVPEPTTVLTVGLGLVGLGLGRRRKRR